MARGDTLEVQLGGPPPFHAVFELEPGREISGVPGFRKAGGTRYRNFQVAGFFKVVIVGDEIGAVLRDGGGGSSGAE